MRFIVASLALIALPLTTAAHHGFGGTFDRDQIGEIEGEVAQVLWRNPHIRLTINALDDSDQVVAWDIEGTSVSITQRRGITANMVNPGDRIRVAGFVSARGRNELHITNILL